VEDIDNLIWKKPVWDVIGHLKRMNGTNLIRRVREKSSSKYEEKRPIKFWDEVVKEDMKKRGLSINDDQDRNKW